MDTFILPKNHIVLTSSNEVGQICAPLKRHFGISNFSYLKIYPDMSRIHLDSDPVWSEFFYKHVKQYYDAQLTEGRHWNTGFSPLFALDDACLDDALLHDVGEGIVLSKHHNGCTELFFLTHRWSHHQCSKLELLLRNIDLIESFTDYFKERANDLITEAEKDPIILPFITQQSCKAMTPFDTPLRSAFKQAITREIQRPHLTEREVECVKYSSWDLSAKQVSDRMGIRTKTVERHIENAKNKLGFRKKASLIKYYLERYSEQIG